MKKDNSVSAGQIYDSVIMKERRGQFLGGTVQVIPHITDEIKSRAFLVANQIKDQITIIEIGGTVGDIEAQKPGLYILTKRVEKLVKVDPSKRLSFE